MRKFALGRAFLPSAIGLALVIAATFLPGSAAYASGAHGGLGAHRSGETVSAPLVIRGGFSVAISGGLAFIGLPGLDHYHGGVVVYRRSGTTWRRARTLIDPDPQGRMFGSDIATSGSTIIIGALGNMAKWPGAAFIYTRSGGRWPLRATLTAPGHPASGSFASSVALSGSTAIVGGSGYAYVFRRLASGKWPLRATLTEPADIADNSFPWDLAISHDTAVLSDPYHFRGDNYGAAYVFARVGGAWRLQQAFNASAASLGLGFSVAIQGATMVIGGQRWTYVYRHTRSGWQKTQTLAGPVKHWNYGASVAISGTRLLVGDPNIVSPAGRHCGSVFEYLFSAGKWRESARIFAPHKRHTLCRSWDDFGDFVALSGRTATISTGGRVYIMAVR